MAFYLRITLKVCASGYAHVSTNFGKEMERKYMPSLEASSIALIAFPGSTRANRFSG